MDMAVRTGAWAFEDATGPQFFGGLCFTAEEDNSTIQLKKVGSAPTISLMKSDDGIIWSSYTQGDIITLATAGDKVYFKNSTTVTCLGTSTRDYNNFVMTGKVAASGNIMSLLSPDFDGELTMGAYCFAFLFNGCTSLTTAPELPAATLAVHCYVGMFNGCTSLTTAPELPATTLADRCYIRMFNGCTSLTQAPSILPAEKAEVQSYAQMFMNCTSLTTAPELPATTTTQRCYIRMFNGCTSLTQAPSILPAEKAEVQSYAQMFMNCTSLTTAPEMLATTFNGHSLVSMFYGCSSLQQIKVHFKSWTASTDLRTWVNGVSPTGTFICPAELPDVRGVNNIPTGWQKVNL